MQKQPDDLQLKASSFTFAGVNRHLNQQLISVGLVCKKLLSLFWIAVLAVTFSVSLAHGTDEETAPQKRPDPVQLSFDFPAGSAQELLPELKQQLVESYRVVASSKTNADEKRAQVNALFSSIDHLCLDNCDLLMAQLKKFNEGLAPLRQGSSLENNTRNLLPEGTPPQMIKALSSLADLSFFAERL